MRPVTTSAIGPAGTQDSRIWVASVPNRNRAGSRAEPTHTRAVIIAGSGTVCDQRAPRAQPGALRGAACGRATGGRPLPSTMLADDDAQFAQTSQDSASGVVDECGPKSPDSHRVVWGLTSRPAGSPAGLPPASRLPTGFAPFARRPPVALRPAFSGSLPSAVARFRFPVSFPPESLSPEQPSP